MGFNLKSGRILLPEWLTAWVSLRKPSAYGQEGITPSKHLACIRTWCAFRRVENIQFAIGPQGPRVPISTAGLFSLISRILPATFAGRMAQVLRSTINYS